MAELDGIEKRSGETPHPRLARGEPLRRVNQFFATDEKAKTEGATVHQIAQAAELGWTTVRHVLTTPKNGFVKNQDDDRWKKRQSLERKMLKVVGET